MAPDWPELVVRPPARCFGRRRELPGRPCGRRAIWMRPSKHGVEPQYFCDECKRSGDEPIAADALFRRVTVSLDIELAAADVTMSAAHAEALAVVEELVHRARGLLNLHRITSVVGRPARQAPARHERESSARA